MRYTDEHWAEVARLYREVPIGQEDVHGGMTEHTARVRKVQDHYPTTTEGTVAEWVRRCKALGLL